MFWKFKMKGYSSDVGEFEHEGLMYGETMADAVSRLEEWYSDELCTLTIECVTEAECEPYILESRYELDKDVKELNRSMNRIDYNEELANVISSRLNKYMDEFNSTK